MALMDYGILIYKNGKLISEDSFDDTILINNIKFSLYPKACFVKYGEELLYETFDKLHPYCKIVKKINGVYFEIRKTPEHQLDIYIRNDKDMYNIFAGYGIDIDWKLYYKEYKYNKKILRKLCELDRLEQ